MFQNCLWVNINLLFNTLPLGIKGQERTTDNTLSIISGAFMAQRLGTLEYTHTYCHSCDFLCAVC